jgi:hypothetical protein
MGAVIEGIDSRAFRLEEAGKAAVDLIQSIFTQKSPGNSRLIGYDDSQQARAIDEPKRFAGPG